MQVVIQDMSTGVVAIVRGDKGYSPDQMRDLASRCVETYREALINHKIILGIGAEADDE